MEENPFALFDRAARATAQVIAAVKPDQFDDPSPCDGWTVRQVVNHLVTGSLAFTSMVAGGPPPDRTRDHLGDDPLGAFESSTAEVRAAFQGEGALERIFPAPFGEGPGTRLVAMRVNEMMVHGWDVARATGQSTDLDPEVAEVCLASLRTLPFIPRGEGKPFGSEQSP